PTYVCHTVPSSIPTPTASSRSSLAWRTLPRSARTQSPLRSRRARVLAPPRGPSLLGVVASADLARQRTGRSLPVVHVADPLAEDGLVLLRERCDVRITQGLHEADLAPLLADVDALIVGSATK